MKKLYVLYEDNHVLGVVKPGGLLIQGDQTGDVTALQLAKDYLKEKYKKPGNVFLGLVHRLDRPVSGVAVFARTSKAASRLAREFHDRRVEKYYLAVVLGKVETDEGEIESFIERAHRRSRLAEKPSARAREAALNYRVLGRRETITLLEIRPRTGRHHQIRLQLASEGYPVVGDLKYGARDPLPDKTLALHAARLSFKHPVKEEMVRLAASPPENYPWTEFQATIADYFG
jgi:23S rRNA pseudouridine1911/1915/1917 synthase